MLDEHTCAPCHWHCRPRLAGLIHQRQQAQGCRMHSQLQVAKLASTGRTVIALCMAVLPVSCATNCQRTIGGARVILVHMDRWQDRRATVHLTAGTQHRTGCKMTNFRQSQDPEDAGCSGHHCVLMPGQALDAVLRRCCSSPCRSWGAMQAAAAGGGSGLAGE